MKYVEVINNLIKEEVAKPEHLVVYGQNINAGSCLGGFTRGMKVSAGSRIINFTNTENSLVGFGFGLMLSGAKGLFCMKQMDFLLLGIDQLVNTYNIIRSIRHQPKDGSFTILAIMVDSGFEGPQSSLNNFADFCSIANIEGFTVTNVQDAEYILRNHLTAPGFRIIGISQRLGKTEIIEPGKPLQITERGEIFQYSEGSDVTVVSFNLSFPQVHELCKSMKDKEGMSVAHFNVNAAHKTDWLVIRRSAEKTKKIIIVDDSKSGNIPADNLLASLADLSIEKRIVIRRELKEGWLHPCEDLLKIDWLDIMRKLKG